LRGAYGLPPRGNSLYLPLAKIENGEDKLAVKPCHKPNFLTKMDRRITDEKNTGMR
jgi:hypothetical protein